MAEIQKDILIVGAGPTGLGAAWRLNELATRGVINPLIDWLLVERSQFPGGMAMSTTDSQGFTWDLGGHVVYSHYKYFDALLDELVGGELLHHERKGWVWMHGRYIPFPIQRNLHHLPPADLTRCLKDLIGNQAMDRGNSSGPTNFAEWLRWNFGQSLTELFFLPYNFKMWAYPADEMGIDWTQRKSGSRYANVPLVDVDRLLENVVCRRDDPGWTGASLFPYPVRGGIGALWQRAYAKLPADRRLLDQELVSIDTDRRIARFSSGLQVAYRHLVSSMALPDLLAAMPADAADFRRTCPLKHSRSHVVGFGLRGETPAALRDKCWVYVPELNLPFFRVTVISNYSPNNVPDDGAHWSLLCEVSESPYKPIDTDEMLAEVEAALTTSFLPPDQTIVSRWYRYLDYGYPVPCLQRDGFLREVEPWLRRRHIRTRGRFGGWKYETSNQDNGFMQGVEAVDSILFGAEELSYFYPDLICDGAVQRVLPN
ncbi:MAG: NAD(P)-binding protein [Rhodospirillales bacterium]|nr:NAD(P)-binding protein [Rhodospirillales bacterium]